MLISAALKENYHNYDVSVIILLKLNSLGHNIKIKMHITKTVNIFPILQQEYNPQPFDPK